jgi:hypothetical protein
MRFALLFLFVAASFTFADGPAKKRPSVTDEKSGVTATVKDDDRTIVVVDKKGNALVLIDVIMAVGERDAGQHIVRELSIKDDVITAIYGRRSFAKFDLKTGKFLEKGTHR